MFFVGVCWDCVCGVTRLLRLLLVFVVIYNVVLDQIYYGW